MYVISIAEILCASSATDAAAEIRGLTPGTVAAKRKDFQALVAAEIERAAAAPLASPSSSHPV